MQGRSGTVHDGRWSVHGRCAAAILLLLVGAVARAQGSAGDACNSVRIFPFPVSAGQPLTVQVDRLCSSGGTVLAAVETNVSGSTIRVGTLCSSPITVFSCQRGQAELAALDPGRYAIEVYDLNDDSLVFTDSVGVGRVTAIPALQPAGIALLVIAVLSVAAWAWSRQPGRSRFSNKRS